MIDIYIPPLRTNSGTRFGYHIKKTEKEIAEELEEKRLQAVKKPAKLSKEELKRRKRERDKIRYASTEYREHRRLLERMRLQNPEYRQKRREQQKAYRERRKAEKAAMEGMANV